MAILVFESLFKEFAKFLNNYDNYDETLYVSNNLANINKNMRKKYHYWKLNIPNSINYCTNKEFKIKLHLRLTSIQKQLILHLCNYDIDNLISKKTCKLHALQLNYSKVFQFTLLNIKILNISYTTISDLSIFKNSKIYNLNLKWCLNITNEQLKYIAHIPILNLEGCNISDISLLLFKDTQKNTQKNTQKYIKKLNIGYTKIKNVSLILSLTTLDVSKCINFVDLTSLIKLKNLKVLNLHCCVYMTNFKLLMEIGCKKNTYLILHTLVLSYTIIINDDLQYLLHVVDLDLSGCYQLTNIETFANTICMLKKINISYCKNITSISKNIFTNYEVIMVGLY